MKRAPAFLALAAAILIFWGQAAQAQQGWLSGRFGFIPGVACVVFIPETAVTAYAAYWGSATPLFPQTGDVTYVQGVAAVVGNPCSGADALGFEFFLPEGAELAVSTQTPVRCILRRLRDGYSENVPLPGNTGACSQTPATGPNGGLQFGFAVVPAGWSFEINVPVRFNRALTGLAEPPQRRLRVLTSSSNGTVVTEQFVVAGYRALVNYDAPSSTRSGNTFDFSGFIHHYGRAGTGFMDFRLSQSDPYSVLSNSSGPVTVNVPSTNTISRATWSITINPGQNYTLYWRVRFRDSGGVEYVGPEQIAQINTTSSGGNPSSTFALTLNKGGTGAGSVSSNPQGLNCGATCTQNFTSGTVVTLTATPDPGSSFTGWSGCTGPVGSPTCSVTMDQARTVTANFAVLPPLTTGSFSITTNGLPNGSTASVPVTGPNNYNRTFEILTGTGQSVSSADAGQYFTTPPNVSFGGSTYVASPATQSFVVPGGGNPTFTVEYKLGRSLTLNKSGAGSGSVTSNPAGINCGATCNYVFADGASVTLTPNASAGSVFAGWSGACSGTGGCTVTMSAARTVTATFNQSPTQTLTVSKAGSGTGSVSSNPAGISCGANCAANFAQGSTVTLTATPDSGSTFTGWSGACNGTGTCSVTMDAAKTVTATFTNPNAAPATLTVAKPVNAPADATRLKGDTGVPALAFTLTPSGSPTITSFTLQASGSGNDALDITAVRVYLDTNGNGQVDSGETAPPAQRFNADNGTLSISLTGGSGSGLSLDQPAQFLVTVDFNTTLASRPAVLKASSLPLPAGLLLALAPMVLLGAWRLRSTSGRLLGLSLILLLTAGQCGNSPTLPAAPKTYQINLTAVGTTATPSGLPITGATITVQK